ncbi:hypothetical protein C1752_03753 [Acaryochloris thomasi RCC1774]|uniref:PAS domain-containing protein n=1 Tax=Acaryochloris thomasi RCC1774 TaxID=1764569 RepID=A0A2W1JFV0_9CYAN|nr:PAS domain S-box protein [Acaryochloris thomasi]PZD72458.1 hypothetical protein C1752_03753 [Acaryochloris thomasi RCC1774]
MTPARTDPASQDTTASDFESFFHLSLDMLCITDFDGYFKQLNPIWEEILGFTQAELLNTLFIDLIHPDDRIATFEEFQKLLNHTRSIGFETRYRCSDGSYRWLRWNATPCPKKKQIYCIARDITADRQTESELHLALKSLTKLKLALDQAAIVAVTDQNGKIISVNDHFCELSQYSREELLGKTHRVINADYHDQVFFQEMWSTIRQGHVWNRVVLS